MSTCAGGHSVRVNVEGQSCDLLVDTGAAVSIIKDSMIDGRKELKRTSNRITDINGRELPVMGKVNLNVDLGEQEVAQDFVVCESKMPLSTTGILGEDFLAANQATICYRDQSLQIGSRKIQMESIADGEATRQVGVRPEKSSVEKDASLKDVEDEETPITGGLQVRLGQWLQNETKFPQSEALQVTSQGQDEGGKGKTDTNILSRNSVKEEVLELRPPRRTEVKVLEEGKLPEEDHQHLDVQEAEVLVGLKEELRIPPRTQVTCV